MDAVADPACSEVVLMSSAQVGKTEILNNIVGFYIEHDPCPILLIQPTLEMAETWSKDRLAPMIRDTPALRALVAGAIGKTTGNTLRHKVFPGGHITTAGANSPVSLASRPVRILLGDERDRWPVSAGAEGDPWRLGSKRVTTFWNAKKVSVSTPTWKGGSAIEREYESSSRERYHVPCPDCGEYQILTWNRVIWLKDVNDKGDTTKHHTETAEYTCKHCGSTWNDAKRWRTLAKGRWIAEDPGNPKRGFHLNEIYSPWVKLADMAKTYVESKNVPSLLQAFVNTSLGETWEDQTDGIDHEVIYNRRETWEEVPQRAVLCTAGVDVQVDRLELEVVAWAPDEESWSLHYEQIMGDTNTDAPWSALESRLRMTWPHESGREMPISTVCVDSGYATHKVYSWCARRPGVHAIKGMAGFGKAALHMRSLQRKPVRIWVQILGVDNIKSMILQNLSIAKPGPRYSHFPLDRDMSYFVGLTSEHLARKYVAGREKMAFVQHENTLNEPLDLRVYATAAMLMAKPDWDALAEQYGTSDPQVSTQPAEHSRAARTRRPGPSNWVTSW